MLTTIFVLIKCELGQANRVAADIVDNVPHVSEVYSTSGQYDLIAKFSLDKTVDVGLFINEVLQARPHIRDTWTIMTFSPFNPSGRSV
jgi:DNA-binding Lrp family transcriptional regulator